MYVDGKGVNSNKFYNMVVDSGEQTFTAHWGRVGSPGKHTTYPISKWNSTIKSKIKKGYEDISHLKKATIITKEASNNKAFDEFFSKFNDYTRSSVRSNYIGESCTQKQIDEAQQILNGILKQKKVDQINDNLTKLYKVIPRRMGVVSDYLIDDIKQVDSVVKREQDALDSMDSSNITLVANPLKDLNIDFREVTTAEMDNLEKLMLPTNSSRHKIHRAYAITQHARQKSFEDWVNNTENKECELLIHGTRNPNIFSILKSGLLVRPTNAVSFAGSAYGDGVYHSAHTQKSLGYTGYDPDKIFFIQNVNMGKPYVYSGWYRDGKDLSRSEMNYAGVRKHGCDSLYVKPGDGLQNSEYIVYNSDQTVTSYLTWWK